MPLNSVQSFVKKQLDNLDMPLDLQAAQAWVQPPIVGDMAAAPQIYIWSSDGSEHRKTMAGGRSPSINTTSGFRDLTHQLNIWIKYAMPNEDPQVDNIFPLIIDTVMQALRGIPIVQQITDPETGWPSTINEIGEEMVWHYGEVYTSEDQRYLIYEATVTTTVREKVQQ